MRNERLVLTERIEVVSDNGMVAVNLKGAFSNNAFPNPCPGMLYIDVSGTN